MGVQAIGTYPVLDNATCRWGCIDIDERDYDQAKAIQSVWRYFGITSFIEPSRSKGYHVWTFTDQWTSAHIFRNAGRYVATIANCKPDIEVNPKANAPWLTPNGYVNTVRLPYAGNRKLSKNYVQSLEPFGKKVLTVEQFTDTAWGKRASISQLKSLSNRWKLLEEEKRLSLIFAESAAAMRVPTTAQNQDAWHILEGARQVEHGERDNQIHAVARLMYGSDIPYDLAISKMSKIYDEQVTDHDSYPKSKALEKVMRIYERRT
jgi:hypothetical protein